MCKLIRFINRVKDCIYDEIMLFDSRTDYEYCNDTEIYIPLIGIHCNIILGYYDELGGMSYTIFPNNNNKVNVESVYEILPPSTLNSMVVYNGTNHFKYQIFLKGIVT